MIVHTSPSKNLGKTKKNSWRKERHDDGERHTQNIWILVFLPVDQPVKSLQVLNQPQLQTPHRSTDKMMTIAKCKRDNQARIIKVELTLQTVTLSSEI